MTEEPADLVPTERPAGQLHPLMKPGEVAALFRVNATSVRRWVGEGKLSTVRTPGGHRRYRTDEVLAFYRGEVPRG